MEPDDDGDDIQVLLRVRAPGVKTPNESRTNFTANSPRHRVFTHMLGLPLEDVGTLRFEVLLNGEHAAEHVVSVVAEQGDDRSREWA